MLNVTIYKGVNNMGLELWKYVEDKYSHVVVHKNDLEAIIKDVQAKARELEEKYPRSRPFLINRYDRKKWYGEKEILTVRRDSQYCEDTVVSVSATMIKNTIMEVERVI